MQRHQSSQMLAGAVLITVGLLFLGPRLGWGLTWEFREMWPVLVIAFGCVQVLVPGPKRGHGVFWIVGGTLLLLDRRGLVAIGDSWPLLIVCAGGMILARGWHRRRGGSSGQVPHGR
jgi:hypothetical protein